MPKQILLSRPAKTGQTEKLFGRACFRMSEAPALFFGLPRDPQAPPTAHATPPTRLGYATPSSALTRE